MLLSSIIITNNDAVCETNWDYKLYIFIGSANLGL